MARTKKIKWQNGDVFLIPLNNGAFVVGQVLDLMMPNVVRCAIFEGVVDSKEVKDISINKFHLNKSDIISLVACTREQLDYDVWKIVGNADITIEKELFPYEETRDEGWVGSITRDASVVESFVNAFHALQPWDDWYKPDYLDGLLFDTKKKPNNLIY